MSEGRFPWRTLLLVSLALNLVALGAVAGALGAGVRLQREAPQDVAARMPGARAFLAALPEETRATMRAEIVDGWRQSRDLRRAALQARIDAFEAASTEPYDVERVRAAFARLRDADQAAIGVFHDKVVEAFATLSVEERSAAIDALRRAPPAQRDSVAPDSGAPAPDGGAVQERRERFREKMRERRERRRDAPQ